MADITVLGELLADFTQSGVSDNGMTLFTRNPGGAVANVAAAAARLGLSTAFIGKVGSDAHGRFLKAALENSGVSSEGLIVDPKAKTTLAFVSLDEKGERDFAFVRDPGADTQLRPAELNQELLRNTRVFHVGSLSLTDEPARSATWQALITAKSRGATVSYDPNYRPSIWKNDTAACDQIRSILPVVDIIKISEEDMPYASGIDDPETAVRVLRNEGVSIIIVTLGEKGCLIANADEQRYVPAFPVTPVDTTGAGDAFMGGFLYTFIKSGSSAGSAKIEQIEAWARMGCAAAAICTTRLGGMPAMPTIDEIEELLNR